MKFLTLFAVAALAMSASAYNVRRDINSINKINNINNNNNNNIIRSASFPEAFDVAAGHFVEGFKQLFPEQFANVIDQYYRAFRKSFEYIPAELKTAFVNVFHHIPSYEEFFPRDFYAACADFIHRMGSFFVPAPFVEFFDNFYDNLPNFYDIFPEEFWTAIKTHLEHAPFTREFLRNVYMVLRKVADHTA